MATIQERKHRLSTTLYRGEIAVSFTACIKGRIPTLNEREVFEALSDMLIDTLKRWNCDAHIFLFMPDHCHLLIQGKTNNSDLLGFMKDFKQRSGYWLSKRSLKAATTYQ
jgi:putative transposase